jgi:16S rRNA (cytidine1402-2'-O)-methyltransferase
MEAGTLYICPTPIGNLEDITLRVLNILKEVDLVAAEDTRHTLRLLNHFQIKKPMTSYHEHNIREKGPDLIRQLQEGKTIALVSDAGMPGISDPGQDLIRLAIEEGIRVVGLPGPSAALLALVISGLPTEKFAFEGFLPSKSTDRKKALEMIRDERRTLVFYESPHRIAGSLKDMLDVLGDRKASLSRELTKHFEETLRGGLQDLLSHAEERNLKGEMVVVVSGAEEVQAEEIDIKSELRKLLEGGMSKKEAVKELVRVHGVPRNQAYQESLDLD